MSPYPKGRTAQTLCRECNTFLGNYDKCYLRFFNENGNPKAIKGFQKATKIKIIKSIFAKFLSVPEAENFRVCRASECAFLRHRRQIMQTL